MKKRFLYLLLLILPVGLSAQDLLADVEKGQTPAKDFTMATFKGTRVVNFQTIETLGKGTLEVRIAHRFGSFSTGSTNLWGLDGPATIQLRVDYAITDRLMIGAGRASDHKMMDVFGKYRFLRQTTNGSMPISLTGLISVNADTEPNSLLGIDRYGDLSSRMAYMATAMVARKFSPNFSLQISPVFIHYNLVDNLTDKNDMLSVAGAARYKFTKRTALTVEYLQRITPYSANMSQYHNVLSIGFDIETGGHVFQVFVTNGFAINEVRAIPYTTAGFSDGMSLGFNLSRVFSLRNKK